MSLLSINDIFIPTSDLNPSRNNQKINITTRLNILCC
ncbi:unnamed protein product [Debaryomyces tyrocola]|nr:unnamed protein product [Debaryomyces tyrocola]